VISIERFRTLAIEAKRRLEGSGLDNVEVAQGDALVEVPGVGQFERAFIDFAVAEPPAAVTRRLAEGAICVFARPAAPMCHIVRAERLPGGPADRRGFALFVKESALSKATCPSLKILRISTTP
jgi:protein-L-isoaspartate(D-aspartate) O-methyltransferase